MFSGAITGFIDGAEGGLVGANADITGAGVAIFSQASFINPGTVVSGTLATGGSPTLASIRIGTVSFNLGPADSTILSTADFMLGDIGLADGTPVTAVAPASYTITAVPEPTSIALMGVFTAGSLFVRFRRRHGNFSVL